MNSANKSTDIESKYLTNVMKDGVYNIAGSWYHFRRIIIIFPDQILKVLIIQICKSKTLICDFFCLVNVLCYAWKLVEKNALFWYLFFVLFQVRYCSWMAEECEPWHGRKRLRDASKWDAASMYTMRNCLVLRIVSFCANMPTTIELHAVCQCWLCPKMNFKKKKASREESIHVLGLNCSNQHN